MNPIEAMTAAFAAWEARDPAALAALFRPDGAFVDPLKPAVLLGPSEIEAGNREAMAAVEDVRISVERSFEAGDSGAVEGEFLARVAGGEGRFDFRFMACVDMGDGQIRRLAEYFDTKPLAP